MSAISGQQWIVRAMNSSICNYTTSASSPSNSSTVVAVTVGSVAASAGTNTVDTLVVVAATVGSVGFCMLVTMCFMIQRRQDQLRRKIEHGAVNSDTGLQGHLVMASTERSLLSGQASSSRIVPESDGSARPVSPRPVTVSNLAGIRTTEFQYNTDMVFVDHNGNPSAIHHIHDNASRGFIIRDQSPEVQAAQSPANPSQVLIGWA
jgi:hypothetical protein